MKINQPTNNCPDTGAELTKAKGITRKQALKQMGKYAVVTALSAYVVLNPKRAQAASAVVLPPDTGGNPFGVID